MTLKVIPDANPHKQISDDIQEKILKAEKGKSYY